jgi:hypothetical protein
MATTSKVYKTQVMKSGDRWRWHAIARNGRILFHGAQVFSRKTRTIDFVISEWPGATTEVIGANGQVLETIKPSA